MEPEPGRLLYTSIPVEEPPRLRFLRGELLHEDFSN